MGSTVKRLRGSRTHGGGSHKNRRGAGNRGGRGNASREKHEFHKTELSKSGFSLPKVRDVACVDLREVAEQSFYERIQTGEEVEEIRANDLVDENVDTVKILGNGQLNEPLTIIADEFSEAAVEAIESNGGTVVKKDKNHEEECIEQPTTINSASASEETVSEVASQEVDTVDTRRALEHLYIDLSDQLDVVVNRSGVRDSTPRQRVIYSLMLAGVFLPVIDRPVGYITVTGVIYAILSDIAKYQQ